MGPDTPETDGPLGTIALCEALVRLGKTITLLTDARNEPLLSHCVTFRSLAPHVTVRVLPVLPDSQNPATLTPTEVATARDFLREILRTHLATLPPGTARLFLLSLERLGRTPRGQHCNMRGMELSHLAGGPAIDSVFRYAYHLATLGSGDHGEDSAVRALFGHIATGGIGDGGNEIGMGCFYDEIVRSVPNGAALATSTRTTHTISCGVSNWGGYVLAAALALFHAHRREDAKAPEPQTLITHAEDQERLLAEIIRLGAVDGVSKRCEASVDGLAFCPHHWDLIEEIKGLALAALPRSSLNPSFASLDS